MSPTLTHTEARERLVALVDAARRVTGSFVLRPTDEPTPAHQALRDLAAALPVRGDLDALVAALRLPDGEYVCTRCGLREQRGETPKGDF